MAESIQIQMEGLKRRFKKMRDNASNSNKLTGEIAILLKKDIDDHFSKSQGPNSKWKGLKVRVGKPLLDTGRLRRSIKKMNTTHTAIAETNLEYAKYHQRGTKNIPKRQFIWLSKIMNKLIVNKIKKYYAGESI